MKQLLWIKYEDKKIILITLLLIKKMLLIKCRDKIIILITMFIIIFFSFPFYLTFKHNLLA